jgi:hypothetical protein
MKQILLLSSFLLLNSDLEAGIPLDKFAHAVGTYGLTHGSQAVCNRMTHGEHRGKCLVLGVAVACTIAASKELVDQKRGANTVKQSLEDGVADVAGIGAAVIMIKVDF